VRKESWLKLMNVNVAIPKKEKMSKTRKIYFTRLCGRTLVFLLVVLLSLFHPSSFDVLSGARFFSGFSLLHILWGIWLVDMVVQLIPVRAHISIGSQKQFLARFRPIKDAFQYQKLKKHVISTTQSAYKVFILWGILIAIIGILHTVCVIDTITVFVISVFFYMADLICVLIWCPFRLIMKNKCCTTCRIFNWDHLMMFTPFLFIKGFYTQTLLAMAFVVWLIWELCIMMYPERFYEITNLALRCSECTDKLCTQYCHKLRKKKEA